MTLPKQKYFESELNTTQSNSSLNYSNCSTDSTNFIHKNIPLQVLIRRMLDKAFGKPKRTSKITEDLCSELKNQDSQVDSSVISLKDESSYNETNDYSHESMLDNIEHKDNKLTSIEEESTNSLHHSNSIESTGIYLNGLLKSSGNHVNRIKHDKSLQSRNDSEIFTIEVDTDISTNDSLYCTNFVNNKSSLCEQKDDRKESVSINTVHSFSSIDVSSSDENTADLFNIFKKGGNSETKQVSHELPNSFKKDKTESSIDALSVQDCSVKDSPIFVSTLTLESRTPKSPLNGYNKRFKSPYYNTALARKPFQYRSSFSIKTVKSLRRAKTPKISKVNPNLAKPFNSCETSKQRQMVGPQIMFTPATPQ